MKNKKNLTEIEVNELKKIQETKPDVKKSILFEADLLTPKEAKKRDRKKEAVIIKMIGGEQFSIASVKELNKMLLKVAGDFGGPLFVTAYYDTFRKLTGFKKDEKHPHYNPSIFAVYTLKYVYRRFKIKNLISELQKRNPYVTGQFIRANKHYQYFRREEDVNKIIGFIKDVIIWGDKCKDMTEFDEMYCKEFGLTTDGVIEY